MGYKNILVAVDTTEEADQVLLAAKDLVGDEETSITVVSVIKPLANFYADLYSMLDDRKGVEIQAVERACAWLGDLTNRIGIKPHAIEVIVGTPAVEIRQLAEKTGADLIVLGTHGQHGLGLALGSTAHAVLHGVPCSVFAVKVRN